MEGNLRFLIVAFKHLFFGDKKGLATIDHHLILGALDNHRYARVRDDTIALAQYISRRDAIKLGQAAIDQIEHPIIIFDRDQRRHTVNHQLEKIALFTDGFGSFFTFRNIRGDDQKPIIATVTILQGNLGGLVVAPTHRIFGNQQRLTTGKHRLILPVNGFNLSSIGIKISNGFTDHRRNGRLIKFCGGFIHQLQVADFILHNDQIRHIVDDQLQEVTLFTQAFRRADPFANVANGTDQSLALEWADAEFGGKA